MGLVESGQILITGPRDVFELVGQEIRALKHEVIKLIFFDPKNRLINCETISDGVVDISPLRPPQENAEEIDIAKEWEELHKVEKEITGIESQIEGYLKEVKWKG